MDRSTHLGLPLHPPWTAPPQVSLSSPGGIRRKTIRSITDKGANQLMFKNEQTGKNMSVAEYFASTNR